MNPADEFPPDASIARAMNRVLEAERAAERALSDCQSECDQALEHAREQGRVLLERAHARITALRERVAKSLEHGASAAMGLDSPGAASPSAARLLIDGTPGRTALERLAAELTSEPTAPPAHEPR
ncbi:MAG TPA: hypothetical protein VMU40_17930 [Steroidobacteraceae bacterium]|nr:hypothetical protein [Steroidobacteraceae bacterium]